MLICKMRQRDNYTEYVSNFTPRAANHAYMRGKHERS